MTTADAAPLWCPRCQKEHPGHYLCPKHGEALVRRPADPGPSAPDQADQTDQEMERPRSVCWKCGERSRNARSPTCVRCHESLVPPALVIEFPGGSVVVRARGESIELGRAGAYRHVFARYPNVSRWHATVSVDAAGEAWIAPNPAAPNGTFLNGDEIMERTRLQPTDQIRFATDRGRHIGPISTRVRQPRREPTAQPEA